MSARDRKLMIMARTKATSEKLRETSLLEDKVAMARTHDLANFVEARVQLDGVFNNMNAAMELCYDADTYAEIKRVLYGPLEDAARMIKAMEALATDRVNKKPPRIGADGKVDKEEYEPDAEPVAVVKMKKVRNLMSGEEIEIPEDTPIGCDPSSETYWSS